MKLPSNEENSVSKRRGPNPFREAIPFIYVPGQVPDTKYQFICGALNHLAYVKLVSGTKVDAALNHIRECLKLGYFEYGSVTGWLIAKGIPKEEMSTFAVQEYRVRWLNHMADQWDRGEICK